MNWIDCGLGFELQTTTINAQDREQLRIFAVLIRVP